MGEVPAKRAFYNAPAFRLALVYLAAWAVALLWSELNVSRFIAQTWHDWTVPDLQLRRRWDAAEWKAFSDAIGLASCRASHVIVLLTTGYGAGLAAFPFVVALGALVRTVARARVRAGEPDPLARVRAFARKHAALTSTAPGLLWLAYAAEEYIRRSDPLGHQVYLGSFALGSIPIFLAHVVLTRLALPALLAPTLSEHDESEKVAVADDFDFAAVAVTREAMLAVKAVAGFTVAMVLLLAALPTVDGLAIQLSVALYVPMAIVAALYFRRASRIQVGLDGVHVHGTSRSRFIAFHDLDGVRSRGSDIELVRGDTAVLRLQLHGPDAVRRESLTQRLAAAIVRASEERDQPVTRFVNAATHEDLSRAADGASSYRHAAVSRDQLWAAVEGPAVASSARIAAAKALATSTDAAERARFRIAADQCADPSARAELLDLLDDDDLAPATRSRRLAAG